MDLEYVHGRHHRACKEYLTINATIWYVGLHHLLPKLCTVKNSPVFGPFCI